MDPIEKAFARLHTALDRLNATLAARLQNDAAKLAELEAALSQARVAEAKAKQAAQRVAGRLDKAIDQLQLVLGE